MLFANYELAKNLTVFNTLFIGFPFPDSLTTRINEYEQVIKHYLCYNKKLNIVSAAINFPVHMGKVQYWH